MADHWLLLLFCCSLVALRTGGVYGYGMVNLTYVEDAAAKGAVCLDGTPAAYSFLPGEGTGVDNWVVYLEGGAWCDTTSDCLERARIGYLGSSIHRDGNKTFFTSILDRMQVFNPDFYNWNKVRLLYCDGSSFMGDAFDPTTNLYYRGSKIFRAVMEELLAKGMTNAKNAILTGTSAGGLATILNCDGFSDLIQNAESVKCISDSGFFLHGKNLPGADMREAYFARVTELHGMAKFLPESCTSRMNPGLCLFPENLVGNIRTPLFLLESYFDSWQLANNFLPYLGGSESWNNCLTNFTVVQNLTLCTRDQLRQLKEFRKTFINTLRSLSDSTTRGVYAHSCYFHGQFDGSYKWRCPVTEKQKPVPVAKIIGDWYFNRFPINKISRQSLPRNCSVDPQTVDRMCTL